MRQKMQSNIVGKKFGKMTEVKEMCKVFIFYK